MATRMAVTRSSGYATRFGFERMLVEHRHDGLLESPDYKPPPGAIMDSVTRVREHFAESIATKQNSVDALSETIAAAGALVAQALLNDGKILS